MKSLGADDKEGIAQTINEEVLKGTPISFRSTAVRPDGEGKLHVTGDLELAGGINLIAFDIEISDDGRVTGSAGITPDRVGHEAVLALFGTLEGGRRGPGVDRRPAAPGPATPVRGFWPPSHQSRLHRLRVESALHPGRQRARAVGVHGDVGDSCGPRSGLVAGAKAPADPLQRLGRRVECDPRPAGGPWTGSSRSPTRSRPSCPDDGLVLKP